MSFTRARVRPRSSTSRIVTAVGVAWAIGAGIAEPAVATRASDAANAAGPKATCASYVVPAVTTTSIDMDHPVSAAGELVPGTASVATAAGPLAAGVLTVTAYRQVGETEQRGEVVASEPVTAADPGLDFAFGSEQAMRTYRLAASYVPTGCTHAPSTSRSVFLSVMR